MGRNLIGGKWLSTQGTLLYFTLKYLTKLTSDPLEGGVAPSDYLTYLLILSLQIIILIIYMKPSKYPTYLFFYDILYI